MKLNPTCLLILATALILWGCGGDEKGRADNTAVKPKPAQVETENVTIGTGGVTGVYYPTGGAIARIVNKKQDVYHIRCMVVATGGSVFNANSVMSGDLDFGLVQSDRQYQAVKGKVEWRKKGPQKDLRAVFSLQPESVTLVAAVDTGVKTIEDLKGKRVNIGDSGSGQRQKAIDALENAGIDYQGDLHAEGIKAVQAPGLLQGHRIDAFFYTVGHPSVAIKEAVAGERKVAFIAIAGIDRLLVKNPYYTKSFIPVHLYPGVANKHDVPTFGVRATLVTSIKVPEAVVYEITKAVFENLDEFKSLHPAFAVLTKKSMLAGLTAPIHPGALKYYKEAGLMQ